MLTVWIQTFGLIGLGIIAGLTLARLRMIDDALDIASRRVERLERKLGLPQATWRADGSLDDSVASGTPTTTGSNRMNEHRPSTGQSPADWADEVINMKHKDIRS